VGDGKVDPELDPIFSSLGFLFQILQSSWNMPVEAMTLKVVLTTWTGVKGALPTEANLIESSIWSKKASMGRLTSYGAFILS